MSSYREISRGIEAGLAGFGVEASFGQEKGTDCGRAKALPTICFAKAARCDLVAGGRKVVGSAQTRSRGTILQHGSMPLTMDLDELLAVLPGRPSEGLATRRKRVAEAAAGIGELLGSRVTADQLDAAVRMGFQSALGVELRESGLSPEELRWADELEATKYATDEWTTRAPGR
jgi:lipoate-protein ligase A